MVLSVRRLTIQAERDSDSSTVDIALPAGTPVCALLPAIVALAGLSPLTEMAVDDWRLDRLCGTLIDHSMTLAENGVHDGELLLLAPERTSPLALAEWNPCHTVAVTDAPKPINHAVGPSAVCLWAAVTASIALACAGSGVHDKSQLMVAAAGWCAMSIGALVTGGTGLRTAAVCLAAGTGFLAVPSHPSAANVFLAATAGCSMSLLLMRSGGRPSSASTATLVATASLSALTAAATVVPVIGTVSASAVGATLATISIGLLSIAPRLSILACGLTPDEHPDDCGDRAKRAHAVLTGMVAGSATGAAIGALVIAVECRRHDPPTLSSTIFTAAVGLALAVRARTYVDGTRRMSIVAGGLCCFTAAFTIMVGATPALSGWMSIVLIAVGLGAVHRRDVSPSVMRAVELIEYAVLVAVVPLACWVGGVYAFVRETHVL